MICWHGLKAFLLADVLPQGLLGGECAGSNDEQNVEDGGTHNGTDPHVVLCNEDANDGSEELRG